MKMHLPNKNAELSRHSKMIYKIANFPGSETCKKAVNGYSL